MTDHLHPFAAADDLTAEPEGSVVLVGTGLARPRLWLCTGGDRRWVGLGSSDRTEAESSLMPVLTDTRDRDVLRLWAPGQDGLGVVAGVAGLEALPAGAVILFDAGDSRPKVWRQEVFREEWLELAPEGEDDGEDETTLPSNLVPHLDVNARILHLWSPTRWQYKPSHARKGTVYDPLQVSRAVETPVDGTWIQKWQREHPGMFMPGVGTGV